MELGKKSALAHQNDFFCRFYGQIKRAVSDALVMDLRLTWVLLARRAYRTVSAHTWLAVMCIYAV